VYMSDSENDGQLPDFTQLHLWNMASANAVHPGFHMPGHAGARYFSPDYCRDLIDIDTTELSSSDDLHDPTGPARSAMREASRIYGSGETLYVTTGSTAGVHIMLASVADADTFFLMPRTVHMSTLHALALLDCPYGFISVSEPSQAAEPGLFPQVTAQQVEEALLKYPNATDIVIVSPDYYGQCADLETIAEIAHAKGCRLLVDEAHGAHFAFSDSGFPKDAMKSRADMCVQSLHKTLPALTMASQIHIGKEAIESGRVTVRRVWDMLRLFETSSPSFVIAASAEYAVAWMDHHGRQAIQDRRSDMDHFLQQLNHITGIRSLQSVNNERKDPLRLVLLLDSSRISAQAMMKYLASKGLEIEFADLIRIVLIISPWHRKEDFDALYAVISDAAGSVNGVHGPAAKLLVETDRRWGSILVQIPQRRMSLRAAFFSGSKHIEIDLSQAEGKTCASVIAPYPPGIALLWPGEIISGAHVELLQNLCSLGISVRGVSSGRIEILP